MQAFYKYTILTRRWKDQFDSWASDNSGATAVEFALIAGPLFFLIFGLLEISMIFIVSTTLEHGLNEATRDIRTGNFQESGADEAAFLQTVCNELFGLLDCDDNLSIDVRTFTNFNNAQFTSGVDDQGNYSTANFQFSPGGRDAIVLARAYYEWELFTPVISAPLANLENGNMLISAGVAFRNEPFN